MRRAEHVSITYAKGFSDIDFILAGGSAKADVIWDDGDMSTFVWFHDEITITEEEFLGKTQDEIHAMMRAKDEQYLRS